MLCFIKREDMEMEQITITLTADELVELNAARAACFAYMSPLPCTDELKKMLLYGARHYQKAMDESE